MRLALILCAALLTASPAAAEEKSPREAYERMWRNTLTLFGAYVGAMECLRKEKTLDETFLLLSLQDLGERDFNMARAETGAIVQRVAQGVVLKSKTEGKCPDDDSYVDWPKALARTYQMRGAHLR